MDIRISAVEEIVKNGNDIISGYFRGKFSDVLKAVKVNRSTVKKNMWQKMRTDHSTEPRKHGDGSIRKNTQYNRY